MRIEMNCRQCGNNRFTLQAGQADDATICCGDCGEPLGTLAELKERVAAEVLKRCDRPRSDQAQDSND
jgi:uncharacterized Zn finger protein